MAVRRLLRELGGTLVATRRMRAFRAPALQRSNPLLAAALVLVASAGCTDGSGPADDGAARADSVSSSQWAADMARFAELDAVDPPPPDAIVFTGSSSIRMWASLKADFPDKPVLNRGFGGSQIRDVTRYADEVAIRHRPRQIVVYAGDNDIDAGRRPRQVLADFHAFVARIRRDLPDVPIAWISIKPSPARAAQLDAQRAANALVREAAADLPGVSYVDVLSPMLDPSGRPRAELFIDDGLHMNARGYALWRRILGPRLE